ncbi:MAG: TetR/AcrR family transcriptional regulator, partial [Burkholderiaceae bacterium]|nr:TetR/AcrR family transcriptional regulator [Burkholderiaceae bacterium]
MSTTKSPEHVASAVSDPKLVGERRARILDAAVKLFSEEGYYVTTVQQIARASGVSIGLIYQYFGDKDDI